jgi:antirestriction protein ArdC
MARNLYREVTDRILAELQTGTVPWVKPWSAYSGPQTPHNATTGRPYSGVNVVMLWSAARGVYDVPRWLTFKQATDAGGNVRKGEKGTKVVYVNAVEKQTTSDSGKTETQRIPFLKEYTVFNIAQCENLPEKITAPHAPKVLNTDQRNELAEEFIRSTLADIRHGEGSAYYRPSTDSIMLPDFEAFRSADHYYNTAFHELSHWTGHERRLKRDLGHRFGSNAYAAEELIAELSAAFLCAEFQFDGELQHSSYIASWIKLLEKDERAFFTAASAAQKAADYLRGLALAQPMPLAA